MGKVFINHKPINSSDITAEFCRNLKMEESSEEIEKLTDDAYTFILNLIIKKVQVRKKRLWDDNPISVLACNSVGKYTVNDVGEKLVVNVIVKKLRENGFSVFRIPFTDIYRISWT